VERQDRRFDLLARKARRKQIDQSSFREVINQHAGDDVVDQNQNGANDQSPHICASVLNINPILGILSNALSFLCLVVCALDAIDEAVELLKDEHLGLIPSRSISMVFCHWVMVKT
jgi:hypothetical protein